MKHIRLFIATLLTISGIGVATLSPALASAQSSAAQTVCSTLEAGNTNCDQPTNGVNINSLITNIINIFSWVVGVTAVIMIIIGGFRYVTSNGDSNGMTSARNTIIYAIIGLVIVALAQAIVQFVLKKIS